MKNERKNTNVTTGKVRFSYVHIFDKFAMEDEGEDRASYNITVLIPKNDTATIETIKKAINNALINGKDKVFNGSVPSLTTHGIWNPLRDGDQEESKKDKEEFKGMMFLKAKTTDMPGIVDINRNEILDRNEVYSGCYGRINMSLYPFNKKGSKGVAAALNHVQKTEDGEPLGGSRISVDEAFGDVMDDPMMG